MGRWLVTHGEPASPAHRYSPEAFGLTPDEIQDRFAAYIDRFVAPHASSSPGST